MTARQATIVPGLLLLLFLVIWLALAIAPRYREDWLLENLPVLIAVPVLIASHRRLAFSASAYAGLFVFLVLHEIGAHYTYSEVPYDHWFEVWLGVSPDALFGFRRNQYDRAIHFLYGLLVSPAIVELLAARAPASGIWRQLLPVMFVMANSVLYELVEWAAALRFGGELGLAYLGAQGDPWDAQKDMLAATLGSVLAIMLRPNTMSGTQPPSRSGVAG